MFSRLLVVEIQWYSREDVNILSYLRSNYDDALLHYGCKLAQSESSLKRKTLNCTYLREQLFHQLSRIEKIVRGDRHCPKFHSIFIQEHRKNFRVELVINEAEGGLKGIKHQLNIERSTRALKAAPRTSSFREPMQHSGGVLQSQLMHNSELQRFWRFFVLFFLFSIFCSCKLRAKSNLLRYTPGCYTDWGERICSPKFLAKKSHQNITHPYTFCVFFEAMTFQTESHQLVHTLPRIHERQVKQSLIC